MLFKRVVCALTVLATVGSEAGNPTEAGESTSQTVRLFL